MLWAVWLGGAVLVAAILGSAPAKAADIGWCGTPEQMTAKLRAEGQRSLAYGNQRIRFEELPNGKLREVDKQVGLIFTADADGRVGYMIQADKPMGTRAQKMCVADRWHEVRLYDARRAGVPHETQLDSTEEAARARCDRLVAANKVAAGSCGFQNEILQRSDQVGQRVALQGFDVRRQPDGSYRPNGVMATVTLIVPGNGTDPDGTRSGARDGRGAILYAGLPEGAMTIGSVFTEGAYTKTALEWLRIGNASVVGRMRVSAKP